MEILNFILQMVGLMKNLKYVCGPILSVGGTDDNINTKEQKIITNLKVSYYKSINNMKYCVFDGKYVNVCDLSENELTNIVDKSIVPIIISNFREDSKGTPIKLIYNNFWDKEKTKIYTLTIKRKMKVEGALRYFPQKSSDYVYKLKRKKKCFGMF